MKNVLDRRQLLVGTTALAAGAMAVPAFAASGHADLVLVNGRITTMDPARPDASALAVRDGSFLSVCTDADMLSLI